MARVSPSVRVRILAAVLAVAAAGMAVAGATAYLVQRERTLQAIDGQLVDVVQTAQTIAGDSGAATLDQLMGDLVQQFRPGSGEASLGVIDGAPAFAPAGSVSFRLETATGFIARVVSETAGDNASQPSVVRGTAAVDGRSIRYVAVPVAVGGDTRSGLFVVAVDIGGALQPIDDAFATFALVALGALVVVGLVGWFVAGSLLQPIRRLRDAAARITASDLSERIPVTGRDDVSELTRTVNEMLGRLDDSLGSQRRLLDDVGHELKTPITIVRGHLEVMNPRDPADVTTARALAIDELDRMNGLVGDIATLAEVQPMRVTLEPTDIAALLERVRAKAAALSADDWVVTESPRVAALVDADRLTQALLQLAANAVAHGSKEPGQIRLGGAQLRDAVGERRLQLWVEDSGPGIDDAEQTRIFQRFQRGSGKKRASGSGLGLAIVSAIAQAHGGTVLLRSAPGEGSRFTLDLPLREAGTP